ncbi:queuosine precursor transporter [Polaribacter sp. Hel_I_88]|uniref:queuosine precursor transporter n=1 Tax=Polaribacter sp. Hel_I_88 TaxID=1250006 RepID=UPI00047C2E4B|nr:queuosine precursor transporter [Polaribacter sp. Hel_I_88]
MTLKDKQLADNIYFVLAALFIASLVASNLIFQKFFYWEPFGLYRFEISVGILPYPITFLITDILSEIYGKRKANKVVIAGIFASLFSMLIILISDVAPATETSPINNETFHQVFGLSPLAVFASMMAYLFAQFIDIKIFHFWKKLTHGKHLWLRNNFSTFASQFIDTFTVIFLLCIFKILPWEIFTSLLISGFLFKVIVAILDTPLLYGAVFLFRKRFKLNLTNELTDEFLYDQK